MGWEIEVPLQPQWRDLQQIQSGLRLNNQRVLGEVSGMVAALLTDTATGTLGGGVAGPVIGSDCLLDWLWVREELRGRGFGAALMAAVEQAAQARGCTRITLNTFTFQAPGFYPRLGYRTLAEIPDFLQGQTKIYFRKELTPAG